MFNTVEGGTRFAQRMRWSDLDDPTKWVSAQDNEAGWDDLDETPDAIQGAALLGPKRVVIYKENNIYTADYVGLPLIFDFNRVVTGEGLFCPYSLVSFEDIHYFIGNTDIYEFDGYNLKPIGTTAEGWSRVRDFFFTDSLKDHPSQVFGFINPNHPEVWWVYKNLATDDWGSCIVYNRETDGWTRRSYFPMSMLAEMYSAESKTVDQIRIPASQVGAVPKSSYFRVGDYIIISGDTNGNYFLHDDSFPTGDGRPLVAVIETADYIRGSKWAYVNRVNLGLQRLALADPVLVSPSYRLEYDAAQAYLSPITWSGKPQIDFRLTAPFHGWRLTTAAKIALAGYTVESKGGGLRI